MGLYRRGKLYWMNFSVRGVNYQRSTGSDDPELAQKILEKVKAEVVLDVWWDRAKEKNTITMNEVIDRYLKEVSPMQRSHARNQEIASNLKSFFTGFGIEEVTPSLLSSYKAKRLCGEIKYGRGKGRQAGESTLKKELSFLRQVFNKAIEEWEMIEKNPVRKVIKGLKDIKRIRYVTNDEAKMLAIALSGSKIPYLKDMVIVACSTGLRESKITNLTVSQCDFHNGRINIAGDEMKNEEPFSIKMTAEAKSTLQRVIRERKLIGPFVFVDEHGKPYSGSAVSMAFRRACKRAGIENLRFHDLRHDFATLLINNGASLYQVQHALGHKDQRMSARYAHLLPENRDVTDYIEGKGTAKFLQFSYIDADEKRVASATP